MIVCRVTCSRSYPLASQLKKSLSPTFPTGHEIPAALGYSSPYIYVRTSGLKNQLSLGLHPLAVVKGPGRLNDSATVAMITESVNNQVTTTEPPIESENIDEITIALVAVVFVVVLVACLILGFREKRHRNNELQISKFFFRIRNYHRKRCSQGFQSPPTAVNCLYVSCYRNIVIAKLWSISRQLHCPLVSYHVFWLRLVICNILSFICIDLLFTILIHYGNFRTSLVLRWYCLFTACVFSLFI